MVRLNPRSFRVVETESATDVMHSVEGPDHVGAFLREARENTGKPLGEIAQTLRIRRNYLEAIEDGRFSELPGAAYAVGFVRSYAQFLKLDSRAVVERFKHEAAGIETRLELDFPTPLPEGRFPGGAVVAFCAMLAIGVFAGWYWFQSQKEFEVARVPAPPPAPVNGASGAGGTGGTDSDGTGAASEPASPAPSAPAASGEAPAAMREIAPPPSAPPSEAGPSEEVPPEAPAPESPATARLAEQRPAPADAPPAADAPAAAGGTADGEAATRQPETRQPETGLPETGQPETGQPETGGTAAGEAGDRAEVAAAPSAPGSPEPEPEGEQPAPAVPSAGPGTDAPDPESAAPAGLPSVPAMAAANGDDSRTYGTVNRDSRILLQARARSWVQVLDETENVLLIQTLHPGDRYYVPNRDGLTLRTGNAGGLEISVDGSPVPALGGDGTVLRNVRLDVDRLKAGTAVQ